MILGTKENFFGGYDHRAQAGFVHVAEPHISPGKKQWTWGNHPVGYAWSPQPHRPRLPQRAPRPLHRTHGRRLHRQPARLLLPPCPANPATSPNSGTPSKKSAQSKKASEHAALSLTLHQNQIRLLASHAVTAPMKDARIRLHHGKTVIHETAIDLSPDKPFIMEVPLPQISSEDAVE